MPDTRSPISRLADAGIGFDGSPLPGRENARNTDQQQGPKKRIDWHHVTRLAIGTLLSLLAIVLAKMVPGLPMWSWGLVGACGTVLVFMELPQAGQARSQKY